MPSPVEQIKDRLGIAEVVGAYIKLEKAGANLKACCPFHNEKTPSFFVSPSRQSYHCFGCDRGGDIFSFVQEIEGVDFRGALKILADRAGVTLDPIDTQQESEKATLFRIIESATEFFVNCLKQNKMAMSYLVDRGLNVKTISEFRLGYVPLEWDNLVKHLSASGFDQSLSAKAGLILPSPKTGRFYDRFRGRIIFPIFDSAGRPVAFSGRLFDPNNNRTKEAKYINSPQTPLYDKSSILYGFDRAKTDIRKKDAAILVEGQMDLVLSHQAGFANTVAVSGTALTYHHLNLIKRLSDKLIMAFDSDLAGLAASRRAVDEALSLGMEVRAAELPDGQDPADLILKQPENWARAIDDSVHIINFYLNALKSKYSDRRLLTTEIRKEVLPYISKLLHKTDQAHFVMAVAEAVGITDEAVWEDLKNINQPQLDTIEDKTTDNQIKTRQMMIENRLWGILFWLDEKSTQPDSLTKLIASLKDILSNDEFDQQQKTKQSDRQNLILSAELAYDGSTSLDQEIDDLLMALKEEKLKNHLKQVILELRQAESKGHNEMIDKCLKKCQDISQEINRLKQANNAQEKNNQQKN